MDGQKLNSALFSQFAPHNGEHNFEISKLGGLGWSFFPSIPTISAGVRNGSRHPQMGKSE